MKYVTTFQYTHNNDKHKTSDDNHDDNTGNTSNTKTNHPDTSTTF